MKLSTRYKLKRQPGAAPKRSAFEQAILHGFRMPTIYIHPWRSHQRRAYLRKRLRAMGLR